MSLKSDDTDGCLCIKGSTLLLGCMSNTDIFCLPRTPYHPLCQQPLDGLFPHCAA